MNTGNEEQAKLWNGAAGQAWVDGQVLLDGMFEPFERLIVGEARRRGARAVLDVGCGSGATTLAIARLGDMRAVGIDLSAPLIACMLVDPPPAARASGWRTKWRASITSAMATIA